MYRLLMIEDEAIERQAFRKFLTERFPQIEVLPDAVNGLEGIELTHEYEPDILVIDINMPELDGLHTLKMLRSSGFSGKIIIHSAYDYFSYVKDALNYGADAYLLKPEKQEVLFNTIQNCLFQIDEAREKKRGEEQQEKHLSRLHEYITEELVTAITSDETTRQQAVGMLDDLGIDLPPGFFLTVELLDNETPMHTPEGNGTAALARRALLAAQAAVHVEAQLIFSRAHQNRFSVLVSAEAAASLLWQRHTAETAAMQMHRAILKETGAFSHIGVGRHYDRVENIYRSYLESIQVLCNTTKEHPLAFSTGPALMKHHEIWRRISSVGKESETELAFDAYEQVLDDFVYLIADESLQAQRQQATAFWQVICDKNKATVEQWENASHYLERMDGIGVALSTHLRDAKNTLDIRRSLVQAVVQSIQLMRTAGRKQPNVLVQQAAVYIQEHYAEELSLEILARHIGISPSYLSHMFTASLGRNFVEYLTDVRMKVMMKLLRESNYSTKELAELTGYGDSAYFCKVVKKTTGKTVGELKRQLRGPSPAKGDIV